jgi:hypothetical protein
MEIHKALRKLEPLMPRQVEHWRRTLLTGQAEVKSLLERQILATAYRILGDPHHHILLSLPPREVARGKVHLGQVLYDKEKWDFGLPFSELMQNMAIFGRSGAGKTNVAFQLLQKLVDHRIPFLFLDWKRTVRHLLPQLGRKIKVYTPGRSLAPFPFNPFLVPPGVDSTTYVNQLVDVMADAYMLGEGATSVLQHAIHACYEQGLLAPTIPQVLHAIDAVETNQRSTGWKISARRACESLQLSGTVARDAEAQAAFAKSLLKQNTIIELDGLTQTTKKFLIPLLCYWIYTVQLQGDAREQLQYVIFFEEAHHVFYRGEQRAKETLLNAFLRQCRELGIGSVIIDQHPHLISSVALGNCYTTICMNLKHPTDIGKAAAFSSVEEDERRYFNILPVGHGVVKLQDRWRQPFLVRFPLVQAKKGLVTDEILQQLQEGTISWQELRERAGADNVAGARSRGDAGSLENGCVALLHDIATHPADGVDIRYKRLGVSADKGHRWKQQLVDNGLVAADRVRAGRTYRVVLRLTDMARQMMVPQQGQDPQASFLHEYWKQRVSEQLEGQGYHVVLESERGDGRGTMDISARRGRENLAIEIETGKSDVVANVQRDLLSGVRRVLAVATDDCAFSKVERQLADKNLLIPGRVDVMLADDFHCGERGPEV